MDITSETQRFDLLASIFHRMTGHQAPGKAKPIGDSDPITVVELAVLYTKWYTENKLFISAMFKVLEDNQEGDG